jgi:hypothetical protein
MPKPQTSTTKDASTALPRHVVQDILRDHLADPTAAVADLRIQPYVATSSHSGNNSHRRVQVAWTAKNGRSSGSAEWIVKRWQPGGLAEAWVGVSKPQEALAWRHGLLRPESLPSGISTPYAGASIDADETSAWLAMSDVSAELAQYSGAHPLPPEAALTRVKQALDGLARLHAWWEQPQQQEKLARNPWLLSWEDKVWCNAATYAHALDREPAGGRGKGWPPTESRRATLRAFLEWLAPEDRQMWEDLLCDRRALLASFQGIPQTLLHGDADERHIGLRWSQPEVNAGQSEDSSPELVLIDWEVIGWGLGAFDVKHLMLNAPRICDPSLPCPEFFLSDELPDYYLDRYLSAGGTAVTAESWPRIYDLGSVVTLMESIPMGAGSRLRQLQGLEPLRPTEGVSEETLRARLQAAWDRTELTIERATRALRTWLA